MDTAEFTALEIPKLAVLINCFSVIGSELLNQRSGALKQGYANLAKFRRENKELLEEVHALALTCDAVSALRLSEDLERPGTDALQLLSLVHKCLSVSVFLSHCISESGKRLPFKTSEQAAERRLH